MNYDAVKLIRDGVNGMDMPRRNVKPDMKTIRNAAGCLRKNGWVKQAAKLDGILKPRLFKISSNSE
jgi:hypothetical protein